MPKRLTLSDKDFILHNYESMTDKQLAEILKCSGRTIERYRKSAGLTKRYSKLREQTALATPEIIHIQNNEFYTWLKQSNRLGGQYKVPRLSNDRKIADEILALL